MVRPATAQDDITLTIRRQFPASRNTVFAAWTDPELIPRWFAPTPDHTVEVREYDFRVGGKYQLAFSKNGEPATDIVTGEFCEIDVPERVSYTWTWLPPSNNTGVETLVTAEFIEQGDETAVVLTHTRFADDEMRGHHEQGWGGCLDSLTEYLS